MAGTRRRWKRDGRKPETAEQDATEFVSAAARTAAFTIAASESAPAGDVSAGSTPSGSTSHAAADQYTAWADRLRTKGVADRASIVTDPVIDVTDAPHWSAGTFAEGHQLGHQDLGIHRDPATVFEAYAILELEVDADLELVDAQYRSLAKRYHPDRFIGADLDVQREQAERFRAISTAREIIRQSLGAS